MLGTQAQYPNQYSTEAKPVRGPRWRKPVIVISLLVLVGIGGWWVYQNSTAGQAQSVLGQINSPSSAVTGQLAGPGTAVSESAASAQAPSTATAADTASASAGQPVVQAPTATDQAAKQGLKLPSLAGVAEVAGTPVWNEDGTLLATLDSGALLTVKTRTSDDTWLAVETGAGSGWAQASTVIAYGLHNLATATLPAAVASANTQAGSPPVAATAATASNAADANLSLADLVSPSSPASGSQPAPATTVQLTAKIAATGSRLNVRSGPGTSYQVVAKADEGIEYQAIGRSATGDWLLLQLSPDGSDVGWVSASYVELSGDIQALPMDNA